MDFTPIDLENWPRREHYEHYSGYANHAKAGNYENFKYYGNQSGHKHENLPTFGRPRHVERCKVEQCCDKRCRKRKSDSRGLQLVIHAGNHYHHQNCLECRISEKPENFVPCGWLI